MKFIVQSSTERGSIHSKNAYAQGKMLNHSGWTSALPRNVTPSDIDMVFDNDGWLMFVELKSAACRWKSLPKGQQLLYQNVIGKDEYTNKNSIAVLAQHKTLPNQQIDTMNDIVSFEVLYRTGTYEWYQIPYRGDQWIDFVQTWFIGPYMIISGLDKRIEKEQARQ